MICKIKTTVLIFRYVSPDCPYPVELSLEQKQDIVRGICSEDGQVEGSCFDAVKDHIYRTLECQHYAEFLRSAYYAKHQLEVFSSNGGVTIKGVLNHSSGLNTITMINEDIDDIQQAEYRALATEFFDKAGEYWRQALKLAPDNYPGARNWLKVSGRLFEEN